MGIPSLFKTKRSKEFSYNPRYYSEEKERKAERDRRVAEAHSGDSAFSSIGLGPRLRNEWNLKRGTRSTASRAQQLRIAVLLAALSALVWLFFNIG